MDNDINNLDLQRFFLLPVTYPQNKIYNGNFLFYSSIEESPDASPSLPVDGPALELAAGDPPPDEPPPIDPLALIEQQA